MSSLKDLSLDKSFWSIEIGNVAN